MADKSNKDFAARETDFYLTWWFKIPANSTKASEEPEEILKISETVLSCFSEFAHFHSCKFDTDTFESDIHIDDRFDIDPDPERHVIKSQTKAGNSTSEVLMSDVRKSVEKIRSSTSEELFIYNVKFDNVSVRLSLDGFDGYVRAGDSSRYKYTHFGDILQDAVVEDDPITIEIYQTKRSLESVKSWYRIEVETVTDIWLEDTDVSKTNRERLAETLECLDESLPGERWVGGEPHGRLDLIEIPHRRSLVPWYHEDDTE